MNTFFIRLSAYFTLRRTDFTRFFLLLISTLKKKFMNFFGYLYIEHKYCLKGLFMNFFKTTQQSQGILDIQVQCKMLLYVGFRRVCFVRHLIEFGNLPTKRLPKHPHLIRQYILHRASFYMRPVPADSAESTVKSFEKFFNSQLTGRPGYGGDDVSCVFIKHIIFSIIFSIIFHRECK